MTLFRVFRKSVRFTVRSKRRFLVFLLIFAIVSTLIAFSVDEIESLTTDQLLDQKGVTVRKAEGAAITYTQGDALYQDVKSVAQIETDISIESDFMFRYLDIDPGLRIFSIDINNPWISDYAKPSLVQEGGYPDNPNEILIPIESFESRDIDANSETFSFTSIFGVGQEIEFSNVNGDTIGLEVSGLMDGSKIPITNADNDLWLFMDETTFNDMVDLFGYVDTDTSVLMISFIVEGMILTAETYEQTKELNDVVRQMLEDDNGVTYGNFDPITQSLPLPATLQTSERILINLSFVIIGGMILASLFAYLITRFRRREIAILKAMGYSHSSVRMSLFAEILTTSFSGFALGLGLAQVLLIVGVLSENTFTLSEGINFDNTIRLPAVGIAFLIMVVIALPGMFLASFRILRVSPAEAFRDN